MNLRWLNLLFAFCAFPLLSQAPTPSPAPLQAHTSDLGFSYELPKDWDAVDSQATLPTVKDQATQNATTDAEKKGVECVQVVLTARHGNPASVVVEVALPFACFGQEMTEKDLPGFAAGASEGLKQTFDIGEPQLGSYNLGTHKMWIERASGSPKANPDIKYTVEIACGLVHKAAVCWMTMASDSAALDTYEHGAVTLDGEPPAALVPATAFQTKPS